MPKFNFCLLAVLLLTLRTVPAEERPLDHSSRDYDQLHVSLNLRFNFEQGTVAGKEAFTFTPLVKKFTVLRLHSKTTTVASVTLQGTPCRFTADSEYLSITLPRAVNQGEKVTVAIAYTARPARGMYFFTPGTHPAMPYQVWTQGQSNNNRYWYPAYDLPDDKLTSDITVTIPARFTSAGNGMLTLDSLTADTNRIMRWEMHKPYSNYLTTLIIGEFYQHKELLRGTALDYNMPPGWENAYGTVYGRTPGMISFFSDYLIPYPYPRYAQTTVWDFEYGGMENASATTLNRRLLHTQDASPNYDGDELICHELAHQWFGDLVTCNTWDHIWLNEGFATYFTAAWYEFAKGREEYLYMIIKSQDLFKEESAKTPPPQHTTGMPAELDGGNAYEKGASVLHLLREELGDVVFRKGIQSWLNRYADKTAQTDDFKKVMEEASGKNLARYFEEWIYGYGFPQFHVQYAFDISMREMHVYITQHGALFRTGIPVEFVCGADRREVILLMDSLSKHFTIPLPGKPDIINFNRNARIPCTVVTNQPLEELGVALLYSDDLFTRICAARELKKFGEASLPYYDQCIERELFYGVRIEAVTALSTINSARSAEILTFAAFDDDPRVRETAYRGMAGQKGENLKQSVLNGLECEKNYYVRAGILYAGAKLGGVNTVLGKLWEPSHMYIQRRAIFEGLTGNGDSRILDSALVYLDYAYSNGDNHLLDPVLMELARKSYRSHPQQSAALVLAGLKNPYFRTRAAAASLAAELGLKELLPLLKELLSSERRESVTGPLRSAVDRLEQQ